MNTVFFLLASLCMFAQTPEVTDYMQGSEFETNNKIRATLPDNSALKPLPESIVLAAPKPETLQKSVRSYPEFPGGFEQFKKWKKKNLNFTKEAFDSKISKTVNFCVHFTKEGIIDTLCYNGKDLTVPKSFSLADSLAFDLIARMPKWQPAKDSDGKSTDFWYYMTFRVEHPELVRQSGEKWRKYYKEHPEILVKTERVISQPEFPGGGEPAMYKWMSEQMVYPEECKDMAISGRVTVQFKIDYQGYIRNNEVLRGLDPHIDKEAVRAIREMPRWSPSIDHDVQDGTFILPITFKNNEYKTPYPLEEEQ